MLAPDLYFIHRYFMAEKQASFFFIIAGIAAIVLAAVCWLVIRSNPQFYKGAAIPLFVIGLLQLTVGYTVYARSDKQRTDVAYHIGLEPVAYTRHTEMPRMEKVMKNFMLYKWIEIAFIVAGIVLIMLFRSQPGKAFWMGFAVALLIQAIITLGADQVAEKRGKIYVEGLKKLGS